MQHAIAGPVALRGVIMQMIQHGAELLKKLKALKLIVGDRLTWRHTHGGYHARHIGIAQIENQSQLHASLR